MPELQSVFAAQEAPSGLPASPERVHRPVARLQMPELQSVFVAQAAPPGACANADPNTMIVTPAAAMSFVTKARNDAPRRLVLLAFPRARMDANERAVPCNPD